MNKFKITVTNDGKERDDSFEASATFAVPNDTINKDYTKWWNDFSLTTTGSSAQEARDNLLQELHQFSDRFNQALNEVEV